MKIKISEYREADVPLGGRITEIGIDTQYLFINTEQGSVLMAALGGCCSNTMIHDIIGVKKVLNTGPLVSIRPTHQASEACENYTEPWDDCVQNYGLEIVVDHPEYGEVTCVVSYRNNSNGYYGGYLKLAGSNRRNVPLITDDWMAS